MFATSRPRVWAAVLLLLSVACSSPSDPKTSSTTATAPAATPPASSSGLTLVTGSAPRGSIVSLEPATPREFPRPEGPAVLDQFAKTFVPGVLLVRVGQTVEFRNSEDTPHNVTVVRGLAGTGVFNVSLDPFQKYIHTFERTGEYNVSCDVHPGMQAVIVATATPYFAVADDRGSFTITNVAPGSYKLIVSGSQSERIVEVAGPRTEVGASHP